MINFKTVRWKNFLSTGNAFTEVPLNKNKMTLIVGPNGAGKSQLLDAITFALFNKPFRKINKPSLVNSINGKQCIVEVEFETNGIEYKVVRGIKPAVFEIWMNGTLVDQDAANKDYQDFLEKSILKTGFKSFTQIVILGSATFTPFMRLSAADRREVLDDLLDVQIFSSMSVLAKQRMSDLKQTIALNNAAIESGRDKIQYIERQIEDLRKNSDIYRKRIEDDIASLKRDGLVAYKLIEKAEPALQELKKDLADEDQVVILINEMLSIHSKLLTKVNRLEDQNKFYEKHDHCDTCKQPIDEEFKNTILGKNNKELANLRKGIEGLVAKLKTSREEHAAIEAVMVQIRKYESDMMLAASKLKDIKLQISKREAELNMLSADGTVLLLQQNEDELKKAEAELTNCINLKQAYSDQKEILEIGLQILKDGGIKTQTVKKYLPVINATVNKYLNIMDFMVNFVLDDNFEETIMSRFRDDFSYANFSEGEKARIDLALLLTFRHVAKQRNSVNTNLLILDEVFDGSLDTNGSEELVSILKTVIKDNNVFVISHRESMRDKFDETIFVKKMNNFSIVGA